MIRRHTRTVRRKRFLEVLGEKDAVGSALPGLACGVLGLATALFAVELGRSQNRTPGVVGVAHVSSAAETAPVTSATGGGGP